MSLTPSQSTAIEYIAEYARNRRDNAKAQIAHILKMSNLSHESLDLAIDQIRNHARVALHFHPDRPDLSMKPVAESLLECGVYKSQFETRLSNGSVSAFPGGERDQWEKKIFGGAYHAEGAEQNHRPKYGALNLMLHPDGPSPRFGSCYFLLKPSVTRRCTFTYLDSHNDPMEKGTIEEFDDIMASLLVEVFTRDFAIGEHNINPSKLIHHLLNNLDQDFVDPSGRSTIRNLNHYIEAQVHGSITLMDDVDILVADPSFNGTPVGGILLEIASRYNIQLYWHSGFAISLDDVPVDFRGPGMPSLAQRISTRNYVDVNMIGDAAMHLKLKPDEWSDRGSYETVLQELKLLWHVLVKYGKPLKNFLA